MMKDSLAVIRKDLQYITDSLREEIKFLAGNQLLITGGAGFLGHYLIQSLLYWNSQQDSAYNVRLTVYDNFIRGVPDWLKKIEGDQNLELVKHDITNPLPRDIGSFQYIIHAASIASPIYYRIHPIETMDANVTGLRILLDYWDLAPVTMNQNVTVKLYALILPGSMISP
jgi:nucleoside-diphosphate-sugar epimerase